MEKNDKPKVRKEGIIMRDLKEFIAPIKRKRPTPQAMAYGIVLKNMGGTNA